jgi:predicted metal-dependent enzyme (double-stranded beta helix superfamily)
VDVDELTEQCVQAGAEADARLAVRDVLRRAVSEPSALRATLGDPAPGLNMLHRSPELTIINVVWPPKISLFPHDHRMWAAIAIYGGREDNSFYRREGSRIVGSGGKSLQEGDVLLLGDDAVHSVDNPALAYTGAIHVYGGDFVEQPRSQWDRATLEEQPYDMEAVTREFERAQQAFLATEVPRR